MEGLCSFPGSSEQLSCRFCPRQSSMSSSGIPCHSYVPIMMMTFLLTSQQVKDLLLSVKMEGPCKQQNPSEWHF